MFTLTQHTGLMNQNVRISLLMTLELTTWRVSLKALVFVWALYPMFIFGHFLEMMFNINIWLQYAYSLGILSLCNFRGIAWLQKGGCTNEYSGNFVNRVQFHFNSQNGILNDFPHSQEPASYTLSFYLQIWPSQTQHLPNSCLGSAIYTPSDLVFCQFFSN